MVGPPKASKILSTPIENIQESRESRLKRQQSRFRDRGGIFVPSSRNILADILMGKTSPIKKPRRSASSSPRKKSTPVTPRTVERPISHSRVEHISSQSTTRRKSTSKEIDKPSGKKATRKKAPASKPPRSSKSKLKKPVEDLESSEKSAPLDSNLTGSISNANKSSLKKAVTKRGRNADKKSQKKTTSVPAKSKSQVPRLSAIVEEEDEDNEQPTPSRSVKRPRESTAKQKRPSPGDDPDPSDRPRKRSKPPRETSAPISAQDEKPSVVRKKRRRGVDVDEEPPDEITGKLAKRKKGLPECEKVEDKPQLQQPTKVVPGSDIKSNSRNKPNGKVATKTAKRKENSVPSRRGIPKSILLRIQKSSSTHDFDNEPDPIDFLS